MGLVFNGSRHMPYGRVVGASAIDGSNRMSQSGNSTTSRILSSHLESMDSRASVPDGCRHPVAWVMPRVAGGLSTRNSIIGEGSLTVSIQQAREAQALLVGSGGVLSPVAGLVVQVAALLLGVGGVVPASPQLIANLTALLVGDGGILAAQSGLATLSAALTGSGGLTADNTALASLSATLRGYGELTPEGLRDAVWGALATSYDVAGTMGEKLNDAGSAGNPWATVIESGYTAGEIMQILAAFAAGKTDIVDLGGGAATVKFRDLADTKDRISATMAGSERASTTLDTDT